MRVNCEGHEKLGQMTGVGESNRPFHNNCAGFILSLENPINSGTN
jgi:hypothetical protein